MIRPLAPLTAVAIRFIRKVAPWALPPIALWCTLEWGNRLALAPKGGLPSSLNHGAVLFSLALVFCAYSALLAVVPRPGLVFLALELPAGAAVAVHAAKLFFLGEPLFPWDLLLGANWRQISSLLPTLVPTVGGAKLAGSGVGVLAFASACAWLGGAPMRLSFRARGAVLLAALTVGVGSLRFLDSTDGQEDRLRRLGMRNYTWDQRHNYAENGFVAASVFNARPAMIFPPAGYSRETVLEQARRHSREGGAPAEQLAPNVVLYLAEAFWDPTLLPLTLPVDPIPSFRRLAGENGSGYLIAPWFGGNTANSEFELLTGLSIGFFPQASIPYQQHLLRDLPTALPSTLAELGYRTHAVHTHYKWFWNRDRVYPHLGFSSFAGIEDLPAEPRVGPFPSDQILVDKVIDILGTEGPHFVFALSMSTHGPYSYELEVPESFARIDGLEESHRKELSTYSYVLSQADRELNRLVEWIARSGRPTIVAVMGDHLPALDGKNLYHRLGFFPDKPMAEWSRDEFEAFRSVPVVVWSNYREIPKIPRMGMSFFTAWLFEVAGLPLSPFQRVNRDLARSYAYYQEQQGWRRTDGSLTRGPASDERLSAYYALHYDLLFGGGHALEALLPRRTGSPRPAPVAGSDRLE